MLSYDVVQVSSLVLAAPLFICGRRLGVRPHEYLMVGAPTLFTVITMVFPQFHPFPNSAAIALGFLIVIWLRLVLGKSLSSDVKRRLNDKLFQPVRLRPGKK